MRAYEHKGKLAVIEIYQMFTDFEKKEYQKKFDFLLEFLLTEKVQFDKNHNELFSYVPEIIELAEILKFVQNSQKYYRKILQAFLKKLYLNFQLILYHNQQHYIKRLELHMIFKIQYLHNQKVQCLAFYVCNFLLNSVRTSKSNSRII